MRHGSLFSGIGGFDLAAQWMGWENVFQCEIDGFCQKVLEKNFPNVKRYGDIKEFDGTKYRGQVDIISGGFPCQPFSVAGKRKGNEDERALWFEMLRAITEVKPSYVVAENVPGLLSISGGLVFEQVCIDLESAGYEVQPVIIPAASKNAPHHRERIWIIAHSFSIGCGRQGIFTKQQRGAKAVGAGKTWSGGKDVAYPKEAECESSRDTRTGRNGLTNIPEYTTNANHTSTARQQRNSGKVLREPEPSGFNNGDWERNWYEVATRFCRMDDGIPNRVDRLKGLGNAIVPQVAYEIFKAIESVNLKTA